MSNLEKKREDFRRYLEATGAVDNLTKALIKLYEQKNKPQDAVKFLRREMCLECHDEDQYKLLEADLEAANMKICQLERELLRLRGSLRRTASEVQLALERGYEEMILAGDSEAGLRKVLTREMIDNLKEVRTVFKGTLLDCIQAGLEYLDAPIGAFACDFDAYFVFSDLFNPIIEELHQFKADDKHPELNWDETCKIPQFDDQYVKSIEISCIRNIAEYPFAPIMSFENYDEIQKRFVGVVKCLCTGGLKGKFYDLDSMPNETRKSFIDNNIMFKDDCPMLKAANVYRFWPTGRGIYINESKNFHVWCNQKDHLKFFVKELSGNMRAAYEFLIAGVTQICKDFEIARDEHLGFLTFSPCDLGNTIHMSVHMELNKLPKSQDTLDEIACNFNLNIKKIDVDGCDMLYEISNMKCLGMCEFDTVKELSDGIVALIDAEKSM
ncbi:arginine kinase-like [Chironomus tepperi]|uniref:arginine kinase-like n=1 Tax=Chironomus tepperi TaxID=113505 RepID=UPI00391F05D9